MSTATNPLGAFGYFYVNNTGRLGRMDYPNGQRVDYDYWPNTTATAGAGNGDQRLKQIKNTNQAGTRVYSQFDYAYDPVGQITRWTQQNPDDAVNPETAYDLGYDAADQLTSGVRKNTASGSVVGQSYYGYDPAGNRLSEQQGSAVTGASYNNLNQLTGRSAGGPMTFTGTVNEPATVTLGSGASARTAHMDTSGRWSGTAPVTSGANVIPLTATDAGNNATHKNINVVVSGSSNAFGHDLNGNVTSDGTKTYEWDAANRLVAVNYPASGGRTEFAYNGQNQRVKIVEKTNGSVTSTKQFVWCPGEAQPCEERDGSNTVTKRFYAQGEQIGTTSYFYTRDHLGSVREMMDSSGTIHARYDYDPYGRVTKVSGDLESDFSYAGYYNHAPSGLSLTLYRAYSADLGRWLSRDPIEEKGGINLYGYVLNNPIRFIDFLGRSAQDTINIVAVSLATIGDMTRSGQRTQSGGGLWTDWAMNSDLQLSMGLLFFDDTTLLGCGDQSLRVMNDLQHQTYDDVWSFSVGSWFPLPHQFVTARSSNPNDPTITIDPYNNLITVKRPK